MFELSSASSQFYGFFIVFLIMSNRLDYLLHCYIFIYTLSERNNMITQLRFTAEDIARHKLYYFRFFIQLLCSVLLFSFCITKLFSLDSFKKKFNIFEDLSNVYIMRDQTDDEVLFERINNDNSFFNNLTAFYEYLISLDSVNLIACDMQYININGSSSFSDIDCVFKDKNGDKYFSIVYAGKNFVDFFSFSLIEGRLFSDEEYSKRSFYLPVLLGNQFSRYYEIGDILNNEFLVVGFLAPDSFYLDPGKKTDVVYLNSSIVAPFIIDAETNPLGLVNFTAYGTLIAKDEHILPHIVEKARELKIFDGISFISYRDQLDRIVRESMVVIYIGFLMMGSLLFFCLMCMITTILSYIDVHKREFAVHLLCGATRSDLTLRLIMPVIVMLILSTIISALAVRSPQTIVAVLIFCGLQLIIVAIFPIIKIRKRDISAFLRENEND